MPVTYRRMSANYRYNRKAIFPALYDLPEWAHPQVSYHMPDWQLLRDARDGERAVKDAATLYMPKPAAMEADEYVGFVARAPYYNFTDRTVTAMVGRLYRKAPFLEGVDEDLLSTMTLDGKGLDDLQVTIADNIIHMGRVGIVLDLPEDVTTRPEPYVALYAAENIVDWRYGKVRRMVNGRMVERRELVSVIVREYVDARDVIGTQTIEVSRAIYRRLWLNDGVYTIDVYRNDKGDVVDLSELNRVQRIVPEIRGQALDYVPFIIMGAGGGNALDVTPSPILAIAQLNIAHWRSYAALEQGLYYTGFPMYWCDDDSGDWQAVIAPDRVWRLRKGSSAGILEFNGQGLKFLENALAAKEAQAATLGGRMIGVQTASVSESDNTVMMKDRNEISTLLRIATELDWGMTQLLRWFMSWREPMTPAQLAGVKYATNRDFVFDGVGAREFRAIHAMYKDGVIPVEVLYDYFRRFDVISDSFTLSEFIEMLGRSESFPGQPDVEARLEGYPDRQSQLDEQEAARERAAAARLAERQRQQGNEDENSPGDQNDGPNN